MFGSLFAPASYCHLYAVCKDDSLPSFKPTFWIKKNKIYKVKYLTQALNVSDDAVTIMDSEGNEIWASNNVKSFKASRFEFFSVILN